jgi:hypothetical protein
MERFGLGTIGESCLKPKPKKKKKKKKGVKFSYLMSAKTSFRPRVIIGNFFVP